MNEIDLKGWYLCEQAMTKAMACSHCGSVDADSDRCPDVNKGRSIDRHTLKQARSAFYVECGSDYEAALTRLDELRWALLQFM